MTTHSLKNSWHRSNLNIIDLLPSQPTNNSFTERVKKLRLSSTLESKLFETFQNDLSEDQHNSRHAYLIENEEKELGAEVLLQRHKFTELIYQYKPFRQAALTVIQNIYLFKNRKIFFSSDHHSTEDERKDALMMLSNHGKNSTIQLSKTFQHLIIARIWHRIINNSTEDLTNQQEFIELNSVVENLNTLRNIYMVLSTGLVKKLVGNISSLYRESITNEDAEQIGSFGIARAAYRYHPSCGVRFSTYAYNWIQKEIQRQSLKNRLISLPSNVVEKYSKASRQNDEPLLEKVSLVMQKSQVKNFNGVGDDTDMYPSARENSPDMKVEQRQLTHLLNKGVDEILPSKSADIIKRKYGLAPYKAEQSVIEIANAYEVTRSNIYQTHDRAISALKKHLCF